MKRRSNNRANDPQISGMHQQRKPRRQGHGDGESTDDLIDGGNTGAFHQGLPPGPPYASYQNDAGRRRATQQAGGGPVANSYQGRRQDDGGSRESYLAGAPMSKGPERWNNISTMEALADLIAKHKFIKPKGGGRLGGMGGG